MLDIAAIAHATVEKMDLLGIEPRALRMRSGCDTTTPQAPDIHSDAVRTQTKQLISWFCNGAFVHWKLVILL